MSALSVALLLATMAAAPLDLTSDSDCPSADAVRRAVGALVSAGDAAPNAAVAPIRVLLRRDDVKDPNFLVVEIAWNTGQRSRSQRIAVGTDCEARAQAAAVAVASWLGVLPGAAAQAPPFEATPPPPPPAAIVVAPPVPVALPTPATEAAPSTRQPTLLGAGLGVAGGGGLAPALRLEWTGDRATTGLAWSVAAFGAGPRDVTVGPGSSRWLRPGIELAARGVWRTGPLLAAGHLGAVAAFTFAAGKGYPVDRSSAAPSAGLTTAFRLEGATGKLRPWAELRALVWPAPQRLRYTDATTGVVSLAGLPTLEVLATLGASFAL